MRSGTKSAVLLGLLPLALAGCGGGNYVWGWYIVSPFDARGLNNIEFLASGLGYTIAVALCSITISVILGLLVALPGLSSNLFLRSASRTYVELFRSIP